MSEITSFDAVLAHLKETPDGGLGRTIVVVPEWEDAEVEVKELTLAQMKYLRKLCTRADGTSDDDRLQKEMFLRAIVQPRMTSEQYEALVKGSSRPITRLAKAIVGLMDAKEVTVKTAEADFPEEPAA